MNVGRITLVTVSHLYSTPRVVKEADALHAAGHQVRVVYAETPARFAREHDRALLAQRAWQARVVAHPEGTHGALLWRGTAIRQHLARRGALAGIRRAAWAPYALCRRYGGLRRAVLAEPADLYLAHYPAALAAAADAAARYGAKLGYDLEDLYYAEHPDGSPQQALIDAIERRHAARIDHLSASTAAIGAAFVRRYGLDLAPVEVRNCFDPTTPAPEPLAPDRPPSAYWFSQIIALQRGLDTVLDALAKLHRPLRLVLRGQLREDERARLYAYAQARGLAEQIEVQPPIAPDALLADAAQHQIGFAVDPPEHLSRRLGVTNKLFTYLAAGLAIAATDLPGNRAVLSEAVGAGALYPPGDAGSLAAILARWLDDRAQLEAARQASYRYGSGPLSWQSESRRLVAAVERVLGSGAGRCAST